MKEQKILFLSRRNNEILSSNIRKLSQNGNPLVLKMVLNKIQNKIKIKFDGKP